MINEESRSVLETLARSFINRDDLIVTWGTAPCTDFNKIYIRKEETIVPGVECTPGELWLSQKATTAHESAHLLFTDEKAWKAFCHGHLEAHILNIVEDARVERAMANLFPGVLRWFRFTNEYIFVNRKNWTSLPPQDQALYELCSYAVVGRVHDELPGREKEFVQKCAPYIDRGRISKTTEDAAKEAAKIVEIYKKHYGEPPTLPEPIIVFSAKPVFAPEGELDPRRKPKLEKPETVKTEPLPEELEPEEPKDLKPSKGFQGDKREPAGDDSLDREFDEIYTDHDKSDEAEPCGDAEPGDGETAGGEAASDDKATGGEATPDETKPGEADKSADDETKPDNGESSAGEAGSESSDGKLDSESSPGEAGGEEPGDSKPCKSAGREAEPGGGQSDDLLSGIDDLLEKSEREAAKLSLPKPEETTEEERIEITKDDMKDKFSLYLHANRKLLFQETKSDPEEKAKIEKKVQPAITRTTNEIRKILESRSGGIRRCIPKGWLDRSILWKVAVKEPNIFMRKNAPSNNPDLAVYLLIDCSGSMEIPVSKRCCTRLHCAAEAGILLHRVCKNLNIPHAATGFTTEDFSDGHAKHYKLKEFHEREARIEAILKEVYCSDNVDGFSIRAAAAELLCRPELNKILFVISDGLPEAVEYRGGEAVEDTVKAVREVISYGIGVIGIFIGDERQSMHAKRIYPHLIFLDAGDLPVILAKTLKTVITNPA